MYVKWKKKSKGGAGDSTWLQIAYANGFNIPRPLQDVRVAALVRSERVAGTGKVKTRHIAYLGSIGELDRADAEQVTHFWRKVDSRLALLALREIVTPEQRCAIIKQLAAAVPLTYPIAPDGSLVFG